MSLEPDPGMHAAHRGAHEQPEVIDFQRLGEQKVLRFDHIVIVVMRKARVQPIAGLAGMAGTDSIGKDDEVPAGVEKLARAEQNSGEVLCNELLPGSSCTVKNHSRVVDVA